MINRRNFAIALLLIPMTLLQGCTPSAAQIQGDGAAIATMLNQIAIVIAPTDPTDATALQTAAAGITAATANWTSNSPIAILTAATNAVEVVLVRIGQNNTVVALVADLLPIVTAAITVLISSVQNQPVPAEARKVIPHRIGRSPEADVNAAWQAKAKLHPQLVKSTLK